MNTWPESSRLQDSIAVRRRHPVLDHGALTSGTILEEGGNWRWAFANEPRAGRRIRSKGKSTTLFPSVRCLPPTSTLTLQQRAEQSARFLRTYHAEVDVPFDLIKEELCSDDIQSNEFGALDQVRNAIVGIHGFGGHRNVNPMLAFATGTVGQDLNISQFNSSDESLIFNPSRLPIRSFNTPIRQLVTSASTIDCPEAGSGKFLCVRTFGEIAMFELQRKFANSPLQLIQLSSFSSSDVNGHPIIDIAYASLPDLFVVNDCGAVFHHTVEGNSSSINQIVSPDLNIEDSMLWRIQYKAHENIVALASQKSVKLYDLKSNGSGIKLFSPCDGSEYITSFSWPQSDHQLCVSTTAEIVWIDNRNTKQAVLAWRHHRTSDRTLTVQTIDMDNACLTILSSKLNNAITAYGISATENGLISSCTEPCALGKSTPKPSRSGIAIVRHPAKYIFSVLGMTDEGSIHSTVVEYSKDGFNLETVEDDTPSHTYIWSEEIQELAEQSKCIQPDFGAFAKRESTEVDLSVFYEHFFFHTPGEGPKDAVNATYDTLEQIPSFWKRGEIDLQYPHTLFDIGFLSSEDRQEVCRADFFARTALHNIHGYHAVKQGRIPVDKIINKSLWHTDLLSVMNRISGDIIPSQLPSSARQLLPYELETHDESQAARGRLAMKWETEASDELATDLMLASQIFSSDPILVNLPKEGSRLESVTEEDEAAEPGKLLSQATQALSLGQAEPPPVQFGYFRPVQKERKKSRTRKKDGKTEDTDDEEEGDVEAKLDLPLGIRHLLSEWEPRSDPNKYEYRDVYEDQPNSSSMPALQSLASRFNAVNSAKSQSQSQTFTQSVFSQSQRVPAIVADSSIAKLPVIVSHRSTQLPQTLQNRPKTALGEAQSQDAFDFRAQDGPQSSQNWGRQYDMSSQPEFMTNTQVLPGPFGGRQTVQKKKVQKKRMGGF